MCKEHAQLTLLMTFTILSHFSMYAFLICFLKHLKKALIIFRATIFYFGIFAHFIPLPVSFVLFWILFGQKFLTGFLFSTRNCNEKGIFGSVQVVLLLQLKVGNVRTHTHTHTLTRSFSHTILICFPFGAMLHWIEYIFLCTRFSIVISRIRFS